jgi:hypothetical protein
MSVELDWKAAYREIKLFNWITLLIMSLFGLFVLEPAVTAGIVIGGLTIIANFAVLQNTIRRAFSSDGEMTAKKAIVVIKYYARLLGLGIIMFVLIVQGWVDPIGLGLGLSTVMISLVGFGIKRACKTYIREAT